MHRTEEPPRYRWAYPHDNERNHVAATFHFLSVVLTSLALFKMKWFKIWGSNCTHNFGLYQFMRLGYFATPERIPHSNIFHDLDISSDNMTPVYMKYHTGDEVFMKYHSGNEVMECVTPEVLNLMRVLIMLCMLCIFHSMVGFCLDVIGPSKKSLRFIRRNALPSIWSVLTVVTIVGVCYLVTRSLSYAMKTMSPNNLGMISYENGCYTVTAAGAISLLATACNLLQDPPPTPEGPSRQRLFDDFEGLETFSVGMRNLPPPPPYTP